MKRCRGCYALSHGNVLTVVATIFLSIGFVCCHARNSQQTDGPIDSPGQTGRAHVTRILSLLETSRFNPYEEEHLWAWNTEPVRRDTHFLLEEDQPSYSLYRDLTSKPGFVMISREITSDSMQLAAQYQSALVLVAAPTPFNAFARDFVAVGFFNDTNGVLYSSYLDSPSIRKEELSPSLPRLTNDIALMQPRSQEEIGSGSGYLAFIGISISGQPQSFIARRVNPYHRADPASLPRMSPERFKAWRLTDSLIWCIAQMADSTMQLDGVR